jgi:uncharacterized BrkB/YihY/UPF0761 family membrane protein
VSSPFGAAASIVILMIWVYYAGQIFLLRGGSIREVG